MSQSEMVHLDKPRPRNHSLFAGGLSHNASRRGNMSCSTAPQAELRIQKWTAAAPRLRWWNGIFGRDRIALDRVLAMARRETIGIILQYLPLVDHI